MNRTLPVLTLKKSKKIVILGVNELSFEFSTGLSQYEVENSNGNNILSKLETLLRVSEPKELPFAVIANYKLLAKNDFAFLRAFRNNILCVNIPIIAVADDKSVVEAKAIKLGIDDCYQENADLRDVVERIEFLHRHKSQMADIRAEESELVDVYISPFKRILDIAIALTCITLLSPVLLMTAILIRIESRGSIIYRSKRTGTGYEVFDFFKFRSMYADADKRVDELKKTMNQYSDKDAVFVKFKNDPRITRVGKFIRKTSIDELPQLFNVLRGDMSIVGNRPLPLYEAERLTTEDMAYRFMAPAGITGLWQVTKRGGNEMSTEERIKLDVTYAKKNSFWYDLKILFKTPFAIIQKENV